MAYQGADAACLFVSGIGKSIFLQFVIWKDNLNKLDEFSSLSIIISDGY